MGPPLRLVVLLLLAAVVVRLTSAALLETSEEREGKGELERELEGEEDGQLCMQWRARTDASQQALLLAFWDGARGEFNTVSPLSNTTTTAAYWVHAEAWEALLDVIEAVVVGLQFGDDDGGDKSSSSGGADDHFDGGERNATKTNITNTTISNTATTTTTVTTSTATATATKIAAATPLGLLPPPPSPPSPSAYPGIPRYAATLETLRLSRANAPGGFRAAFYDDAGWMAAALWRTASALKNVTADGGVASSVAGAKARLLLRGIAAAWDETCCGSTPGGMWWDVAHTQKATIAQATSVRAMMLLASSAASAASTSASSSEEVTARRIFDFWYANFVNSSTGAVVDHEDKTGARTSWNFSYNQGMLIEAAVLLAATAAAAAAAETNKSGDGMDRSSYYLDAADTLANWTVAHQTDMHGVLSDGNAVECTGDCTLFKGPAFRGLLALQRVRPRPELKKILSASANAIWGTARDPATGLFGTDWSTPPKQGRPRALGASVAAVQALARYTAYVCEAVSESRRKTDFSRGKSLSRPVPEEKEEEETRWGGAESSSLGEGGDFPHRRDESARTSIRTTTVPKPLQWDNYANYSTVCVVEAEEAVLVGGVGLEARFGNFSGWGYAAGFDGPGKAVRFWFAIPAQRLPPRTSVKGRWSNPKAATAAVNAAAAPAAASAPCHLYLRYATAAVDIQQGDGGGGFGARRALALDDMLLNSSMIFASTQGWDHYARVLVPLSGRDLGDAGTQHQLEVAWDDASGGSAGPLNLDCLEIVCGGGGGGGGD